MPALNFHSLKIDTKMEIFVYSRYFWFISLIVILVEMQTTSVLARPNHQKHPFRKENRTNSTNTQERLIGLNNIQRERLIDLLRGGYRSDDLLSPSIRIEIANQVNSLPPGIQKRLARGKSLPPGIAKKVYLPYEVNDYLNLSQDVKIIVSGTSVIVVDPLSNIIWDVLQDIF